MKRGKTALLLMEQLVMLLVFALAAALCLQAFVTSERLSARVEAQDRAAILAQNAAETLRHTGGDFARAATLLDADSFDEDRLQITAGDYVLTAQRTQTAVPGLGRAAIIVQADDGGDLARLDIAWQEVSAP